MRRVLRVRFDPLLIQAGIAGALSFSHLHDVAQAAGQSGWQAWAYPISVDLLLVASWRRLRIAQSSNGSLGTGGPWLWFLVALVASLGANVATAGLLDLEHVPAWLRLIVAGWPAVAFLGGTLLAHRNEPTDAQPVPAPVPDPAPAVEVAEVVPDTPNVELPPVAAVPEPPALPVGAVRIAPALLDHARRIAEQHHTTTGDPITADVLRARLSVPESLADSIHSQL
ncbi:DUF2637 domain-containing protein [Streptomyces sp. SID3343]|uniref:DUF2637 domain-containing protein n=1 Tax=Streptomyces sp. SID3343 TaxID=2690260 RepID=UPI00136CDC63|nr:DUF2637 domain-containing protein [Streptomyces sp. SID3343]MYW04508.1 DUF2637 domain-containing protein [Streptomyces sp. SID3343]